MKESLSEIYRRHAVDGADPGHGDKGSVHSYLETYARLFESKREYATVMEIGLAYGKSIDLWGEYFGLHADIVGVDISVVFDTSRFDRERFTIIEGDATKPEILAKIGNWKFDIIIDDGSHMERDQIATFNLLKGLMNPGGIYVIEDILNLELAGPALKAMHSNCEVIDLRGVKRRFDDVLLVYRF